MSKNYIQAKIQSWYIILAYLATPQLAHLVYPRGYLILRVTITSNNSETIIRIKINSRLPFFITLSTLRTVEL